MVGGDHHRPLVAQRVDGLDVEAACAQQAEHADVELEAAHDHLAPEPVAVRAFQHGAQRARERQRGQADQGERAQARTYAYAEPRRVDETLEVLVEATARYLKMQADAGAQVLKIFESWAEGLPDDLFERLVLKPHQALVRRTRELGVTVPLIGFPRGSAALAERYAEEVEVDAVALDTACPLEVGKRVQQIKPIQGALDPLLLRAGGERLDRRVDQLMEAWGQGPWVFNLGHGILPDVPIDHVERVLKRIGAQ